MKPPFGLNSSKQEWVEKTFAGLSLNEKIGQMVCEDHRALKSVRNPEQFLEKYPIGGLFVGAEVIDPNSMRADHFSDAVTLVRTKSKVPVVFCGDFEHGIGSQIQGFTCLPSIMGLAATDTPAFAYEYGRIIAEEARRLGLHWAFGPVCDLNTNPENPVTNIRSAGDHPDHVIKMLKELVKGMQAHGCAACPKHFPGDGTDIRNQHYVTSLNLLSKTDWDQQHGKVFKALIDVGAMSIMVGHIGFPGYEEIDPDKQKFRPATASRRLMTDLLRGDLGFEGVIVTDALSMCGYQSWGDYAERIIDTFNGGADIFLWPEPVKFFEVISSAIQEGTVSLERLDESVKRILSFKAALGLDEPATELKPTIEMEENSKIADQVAETSLTLLRNRQQTIPLQLKPGAKILMLVTPETDLAMSKLAPTYSDLTSRGYEVVFTKFSGFYTVKPLIDQFDAVILACNSKPHVGHRGFSEPDTLWRFMACEEVKQRVIISYGTPYFLYDTASAETYINAYSDSPATQKAVVKALVGEIAFSGISPVGIPHCFAFGDGIPLIAATMIKTWKMN